MIKFFKKYRDVINVRPLTLPGHLRRYHPTGHRTPLPRRGRTRLRKLRVKIVHGKVPRPRGRRQPEIKNDVTNFAKHFI